jgi:hypothetical protein
VGARVGRSITLSSSQTESHSITRSSLNQGGVMSSWEARKRPEKAETPVSCKWVPGGGHRAEGTASVIQRHATTGRFGVADAKDG